MVDSGTERDRGGEAGAHREPTSHGGGVRERVRVPPRAGASLPRGAVPAGGVRPGQAHRLRQLPQRTGVQGILRVNFTHFPPLSIIT